MYAALASQKHHVAVYLSGIYAVAAAAGVVRGGLPRHRAADGPGQVVRALPLPRRAAARAGRTRRSAAQTSRSSSTVYQAARRRPRPTSCRWWCPGPGDVVDERRVQPHLGERHRAGAVEVEGPVRAVGGPAAVDEEGPTDVVVGLDPGVGRGEAGRDQRVRRGLQQSGAVPLAPVVGVDGEGEQVSVDAGVAVAVARRRRGGDRRPPGSASPSPATATSTRWRGDGGRTAASVHCSVSPTRSARRGRAAGSSRSVRQAASWASAAPSASVARAGRTLMSATPSILPYREAPPGPPAR